MAKILVIEDEAPLLEEMLSLLGFEGHEAIGAADGREGIELALRHLPDLILSDIMMPGIDGYRVLVELRTHPATSLTPFIFLTARAERVDVRRGMELGADDYLTKPFSLDELLHAIEARQAKQSAIQEQSQRTVEHLRKSLVHTLPHEFRTPLVSVLGYGELLAMDAESLDPEQVSAMAGHILSGGRRLFHLVENYLLYAQMEIIGLDASSVALLRQVRSLAPNVIIGETSAALARQRDRSGDLIMELLDVPVQISEDDLKKITHELVDNALKFSRQGAPVQVLCRIDEARYELRVTDQGRGMTPDQVADIGAYMQFDRAVYEQQGAGLGLAICRRLAELYGGTFDVESDPGRGTQVTVRLPLAE